MTHKSHSMALVSNGDTWTDQVLGGGVVIVGALRADGIVGDLCGSAVTVQSSRDGVSWDTAMSFASSGEHGIRAQPETAYRAGVLGDDFGSCAISVSITCDSHDVCAQDHAKP